MKKIKFNIKNTTTALVMSFMLSFSVSGAGHSERPEDAVIKNEIKVFFSTYINTYNQRFGFPERAETFVQSLSELIHSPFVMAPPNGKAFYPNSPDLLTRSFDGFVQQLEQKGVAKLVWESENYTVLTNKKVLVNNKALGLNEKGNTVYETQSIYLAVKSDKGWQIALFNPYDIDRELKIKLK